MDLTRSFDGALLLDDDSRKRWDVTCHKTHDRLNIVHLFLYIYIYICISNELASCAAFFQPLDLIQRLELN